MAQLCLIILIIRLNIKKGVDKVITVNFFTLIRVTYMSKIIVSSILISTMKNNYLDETKFRKINTCN